MFPARKSDATCLHHYIVTLVYLLAIVFNTQDPVSHMKFT